MESVNKLFDFIDACPTAFHAVDTVEKRLISEGFARLYDVAHSELEDGGKYYVKRADSAMVAFVYRNVRHGFSVVASHVDSPAFKVKLTPLTVAAYSRLEVEKYGGMIYYSWLDRPLSVAGRVTVDTPAGVEHRLVDFVKPVATIPSVAIHLNRSVNDGVKLNPAKDLLPLYSTDTDKDGFITELSSLAGCKREDILGYDLFVYNRERGTSFGKRGEMILSPRLDDLECVYASLEAFLTCDACDTVPVFAIFDNEEVGSDTRQGAASDLLPSTLRAIAGDETTYARMLRNSLLVSADNAHAKHPSSPELSDPDNAPVLNGGIVIKFNSQARYTTDGASYALFKKICGRVGAKTQTYYNRADLPGGSTLGAIAFTGTPMAALDIGFAQLAMHSASESAGAYDLAEMIRALTAFYSSTLTETHEGVRID